MARHILAYGGSRSGKTFGFCYCVAARGIQAPGSRHLIARLHNIDVRQAVMMDTFPAMMRYAFPQVPYTMIKSDQYALLHTATGDSEVWFGGLDDKERIEKILGKEYATIYPNETSQIPYETILMMRTRLAQNVLKSNGSRLALKAYYDLNPTGKTHWSYQEFVLGVRPDNKKTLPENTRAWVQMNPIDNPNLPPEYLEELETLPERQKQRFLDGQYLAEVPGALWPIDRLDATRVHALPELMRIVVAVDPSGSDGAGGDSQGIIVAGLGVDGHFYVLEDLTCKMSPAGWGRRAVDAYHRWGADLILGEVNYGGAMVEHVIRTADPLCNYKTVHASRGKHVRAEPVAALYETRVDSNGNVVSVAKAHHVGPFPDLEDQLSAFTTEGYQGGGSPDRADALVWAATELMLGDIPKLGMLAKSRDAA